MFTFCFIIEFFLPGQQPKGCVSQPQPSKSCPEAMVVLSGQQPEKLSCCIVKLKKIRTTLKISDVYALVNS